MCVMLVVWSIVLNVMGYSFARRDKTCASRSVVSLFHGNAGKHAVGNW